MAPARDGDRVVLDRAEAAEELEHRVQPSFERARGREQLARHEEAARGLGGDLHGMDATQRAQGGEPSAQQVDGDESVDRTEDVVRRRDSAVEANLGRRLDVLECPSAPAVPDRAA